MKLMTRPWIALAALGLAAPLAAQQDNAAHVTSPDGHIAVTLTTDGEGRIRYAVDRDGRAVIAPSSMGFLLTDAMPMTRDFKLIDQQSREVDESWDQPWGERTHIRNHYRELKARFQETTALARVLIVTFRVYDDGLGFRYEFADQPNLKTVNIADEMTEFTVAQPGTAWWIPGGDWNRYEYLYNTTPIDAVATAHTPITMKLADGTHLSFHEAALVDYAGMWFRRIDGQRFRSTLSPSSRGPRVTRQAPFNTPWRMIQIAADAPGLANSSLELNLNEPNKLGDVSWVKPFKYVGIWWAMHLNQKTWELGPNHGATTAETRRYIDFAAKHGFRGVLVEGWNVGWNSHWFGDGSAFDYSKPYPDYDLKALAAYAAKKHVRLIAHNETGGGIADYEKQMDAAYALYQSLGIDSIKTGYVADAGGLQDRDPDGTLRMEWHDGQRSAQHHLKVVIDAASHHIAVDAHEPIKDTGLRRTYPNWVSREAARGMEYNAWGNPGNPPEHVPMLVFTRLLSGPMDYTPGVLSLTGRDGRSIASTLARQLALYVVIYSPIQMIADLPENLDKYPREMKFLEQVPTDWSQSIVLNGEVGQYTSIARKDRASNDWYLGAVTDSKARTVPVTLDFLDAGRSYTATIYRDGADADFAKDSRHSIVIETRVVKKGDTLAIPLAPGGGYAVRMAAGK